MAVDYNNLIINAYYYVSNAQTFSLQQQFLYHPPIPKIQAFFEEFFQDYCDQKEEKKIIIDLTYTQDHIIYKKTFLSLKRFYLFFNHNDNPIFSNFYLKRMLKKFPNQSQSDTPPLKKRKHLSIDYKFVSQKKKNLLNIVFKIYLGKSL